MNFQITSTENLPIRGDIAAPSDPRALVVLVHGFKGFKDWGFFPWLSESLCEAGFVAVRFNMSRSGIGEGSESFDRLDLFRDDTYSIQVADLLSTIREGQSRFPDLPTFLVGHSRGGGVALLAAAEVASLAGVVTWSAIARADRWDAATKKKWRADGYMDIENSRTKQTMRLGTAVLDEVEALGGTKLDVSSAARRINVPWLVVHGDADATVPVREAELLCDLAPGYAMPWIVEGGNHGFGAAHPVIDPPPMLALVTRGTVSFFAEHIARAPV
jgi:pimeloyl-ACP methyl ester carboxylesterase